MSELQYQPSAWGQEFHALTCEEALGAGAAGPGKTTVLLMDPLEQILVEHNRCQLQRDHEHYHPWGSSTGWALHLRRTLPMLEQTIQRSHRIFPQIDPAAEWNEQKKTWKFKSGFRFQFGHCAETNDWENFMSAEFSHLAFDELTQFNEEQYDQIKTRVRSSDAVLRKMLKVRAMSNPVQRTDAKMTSIVADPMWVRRYFVDPFPAGRKMLAKKITRSDGTTELRRRIYLPATLFDNPDKNFVRDYEARLLDAKPHIRAALLYGDWYITVGSFYAEVWNPELHVCAPFKIPRDWPRFRSMDWGFKKPGCVHWYARDPDGNLFVEKEYTFENKTAAEVALRIIEIEEGMGIAKRGRSQLTGPADTQLWEQRGDSGKGKAEEMAELGVNWTKAEKRRERNAERIYQRLGDHDNGTITPGLVFFKTCVKIIQTLPGIQADPKNPECPMDGGEDHWHDSCLSRNSQVMTERGSVRLDQLTDLDRVLSTDGRFWPCTGGRMTRERASLYRVALDNGSSLLATADHRILLATGEWRRVDQLDSMCYCYAPWIQSSSAAHAKNFSGSDITSAASTFGGARTKPSSIGWFGRLIQAVSQPLDARFIIKMRTALTMLSTIWRSWSSSRIVRCTRESLRLLESFPEILKKHRMPPMLGTEALTVSSGIGSTRPRAFTSMSTQESTIASSAEPNLSIEAQVRKRQFALMLATRAAGGDLGSIMRNELALPVGENSWSTGSIVRLPARGDAVRVVSVCFEREDEVWCTTVPGMGAFVAEGIVVSNCGYGVAYASRDVFSVPKDPDDDEDDDWQEPPARGQWGYGLNV